MKRTIGILLAAIMGCLLVSGVAQPAYAQNNPTAGNWYELFPPFFNSSAPKCLDVPNGSSTDGLVLAVFHCHGYDSNGTPQRWTFFNRGVDAQRNTLWELRNEASQRCLNIANLTGANATQVVQLRCNSESRGLWVVHPTTNVTPFFGLSNVQFPNLCLATGNSSGSDHTGVEVTVCNFNDSSDTAALVRQVWSLG